MSFPQAMWWLERGYKIRRAIWRITDALFGQVAGPDDIDLRWFVSKPEREQPGIFFYEEEAANDIVTNVKLRLADMEAQDWTCDTVDPGSTSTSPGTTDPNTGRPGVEEDAPADGGGGSSGIGPGGGTPSGGGGSGGGDSGGSGGSGFSGVGSGGGSGGGGGSTPKKNPRTPRGQPTLYLSATRSGTGTISVTPPGAPGAQPIYNLDLIVSTFTGYFSFYDPWAKPGEIWFCDITHGSPTGFQTVYHGTIASGQTKEFTFEIEAMPSIPHDPWSSEISPYNINGYFTAPGSGPFGVQASIALPNQGISALTSVNVYMKGHQLCGPGAPVWSTDLLSCVTQG